MKDDDCPLCIDLDGTLIQTDTLVETALLLIKKNPLYIVSIFIWLLRGKTVLKYEIAKRVNINASALPYNQSIIEYIVSARKSGRQIWLCTAANEIIANSIAEHLKLFDKVLASNSTVNLSASRKAKRLVDECGSKNFDYAGNSEDDLEVWRHARNAIIVNLPTKLEGKVKCPIIQKIEPHKSTIKTWAKQLRVHQWAKNMLVFVPCVAAHQFTEINNFLISAVAFIAFSFCASSVYILNDLLDLESDRKHYSKKFRPLASGKISLISGIIATTFLLMVSIAISTFLPIQFIITLGVYYIITLLYSFRLKKLMVIDVATLSVLYSIRIFAGGTATGIILSNWLISFSMFLFFSLAIIKRVVELRSANDEKTQISGRGYTPTDLPVMVAAGISSGYISILVFSLYIESVQLTSYIGNYNALYFISPLLFVWLTRIWLLTWRDEMHDDPVAFALKDNLSRIIGLIILSIFIFSSGVF